MVTLKRQEGQVHFQSSSIGEVEIIRKSLSFYQEGAEFSQLYREGRWDGYIKFYDKKLNLFPLGMLDIIEASLKLNEIKYTIENLEVPFKPSLPYNTQLYEHQCLALDKFFLYRHGKIVVPTRGGKTMMASEAMRILINDQPDIIILFVVESQLLFEQAISDISKYLKINKNKIGWIKEGEIEIQNITVGTIQSIQSILNAEKRKKNHKKKFTDVVHSPEEIKLNLKFIRQRTKLLKEYLCIVDFLIVDECHEFGNIERCNIIKKIQFASFKMFMSASKRKSENQISNLNLKSVCGLDLYEIHERILKEKGILAKDKVMLLMMDHNNNKNINVNENSNYREYLEHVITHNIQRNGVISNIIHICRRLALKTLVLFIFRKHGWYIQSITCDPFLTGEDNMKTRTAVKTTFLRKKNGGVLLASDIFKKGITLPEVQVLFNAGGGLEQSNITQKKGRVLGVKGVKDKALIIDIIDNYKYFNQHSLSRIQVYEESVGIDDIVIFNTEDVDFYRDVQDFLKNWFQL